MKPVGPIGTGEKMILLDSLAIMLCIVVPTILATAVFAWWFRASNAKARRLPDWAFSGKIEIVTWSVPLLTIMFLGGIAWVGSHDLDPAKPLPPGATAPSSKPLHIQVVSLDWKWLFIYPDQGIASVNRLVLPVGTPVQLSLTSASVMNTFFVPQLGSMIYTMNGMADQLNLRADQEGRFPGLSGHFSGDGFAEMHFPTDAMAPDAFKAWIDGAKSGQGPTLNEAAYKELSRQTLHTDATTYHAVEPDLFAAIVSQKIPPAPGPKPDISPKSGG